MITTEEGEKMARQLKCTAYLEVGASTGQGMENMLDKLFDAHVKPVRQNKINSIVEMQPKKDKKKKKKFFFF